MGRQNESDDRPVGPHQVCSLWKRAALLASPMRRLDKEVFELVDWNANGDAFTNFPTLFGFIEHISGSLEDDENLELLGGQCMPQLR